MAQLRELKNYLDHLLRVENYRDASINGIQVEASSEIQKIAFAVDSGLSVIEAASSADLLIVHHGLLWGELQAIDGVMAKKLSVLFKNNCSLAAYHLPLDGNLEVGNNAEIARYLGLKEITPAFVHAGAEIGVTALSEEQDFEYFKNKLTELAAGTPVYAWNFGVSKINKIGIISGSGSSALSTCAELGIDLFISGEPKQEAFHVAKDLQLNAIFAGHYATETFGLKALAEKLKDRFAVETIFIDQPTGV